MKKSVHICEICGTKFSSDFTDESEGSIAYRITHGFARIFGRWPMARARYVLLLFLVTQISQMTQIFLRGRVLSHRFHRFTQIFLNLRRIALSDLRGYLQRPNRSHPRNSVSSDEKNLRHLRNLRDKKTSQEKSVYICEICGTFYTLRGYLFFVGLFLSHRFHRYTQIFYGISGESLCPISGGICNDRTGRLCDIP